jgi:HrpA-like RNA helicase
MSANHKRKLVELDPAADSQSRLSSILKERALLPVILNSKQLISELEKHACVVLVGETGSGKTTQIPRLIWEGVLRKVF